ncbi:MAG TPA: EamA family transporter [Ideonella sp.]|uniref:EamA family transporter n=1 Tax=Ideonella sp. TaxID=1929293 RepID=UPI002E3806F7|nr:EamA family transporter [Ideonella sp.]HEX5685742.1 EamA family transporter [Ideonella sp.]
MNTQSHWLGYALLTMVTWGVWGAFTGVPTEHGFPDTLVYAVWALTMIPPAVYAFKRAGGVLQRDPRSLALGLAIGLLGAGGQMLLFRAVKTGPAYLIFPIISLSPALTIALSFLMLRERTGRLGLLGIVLALLSLPLFDYTPGARGELGPWFMLAVAVLVAWGVQAYFIKLANATMSAESIFVYMAISAVVSIPVALAMTDFSQPVNLGWNGPWLAAVIQVLNSIGALALVHAFRHGKAIVVSPMVNAGAPLLTAVIAMAVAGAMPGPFKMAGVALALLAALLLALQPEGAEVKA